MGGEEEGVLLGRPTPVPSEYSPGILQAIPRAAARKTLGIGDSLPFSGSDLWHAYELSWLDGHGKPAVAVGRFTVPASSPNMIESKSFKLYLNSLNNTRLHSEDEVVNTIITDTSAVAGVPVSLELLPLEHPSLAGSIPEGECLDGVDFTPVPGAPCADQLEADPGNRVEEKLYSHLLRSLCPVTGQPDWATLWLHYQGAAIEHSSLLQYIVSYRDHREFHEQCVERIFLDLHRRFTPDLLQVQAFYTRRGGLDISPFRSTNQSARPLPRLSRQ